MTSIADDAHQVKNKRHRVSKTPDLLADYEKAPRTRAIWTNEAKEESRLPVVLPTGETVLPLCQSSEKRRKRLHVKRDNDITSAGTDQVQSNYPKTQSGDSDTSDNGSQNGEPTLSKTQLRRLEDLKKKMEAAEKYRLEKKANEPDLSKGKAAKQEQEVRKTLKSLKTKNDKLAEIVSSSQAIICDPEGKLYRMDILFALATEKSKNRIEDMARNERNKEISTIAFISIGAIMKNCIPGYKLRADDQSENQKLSRDVEKLHAFEATLLGYYGRYIDLLQKRLHTQTDVIAPIVCELLLTSPNFNFSDILLTICVNIACLAPSCEDDQNWMPSALQRATRCIFALVHNDATLDVGVRVARIIGKVAKSGMQKTRQSAVLGHRIEMRGSLLSVLSKINFTEKQALVQREATLRGIKPGIHIGSEVYKDMLASSIYGDVKTFEKNQSEILKELFVVFLRILRSPEKFPADALRGAIEALGRLGDKVNTTLISEMVVELRRLASEESNRLGPGDCLHAIMSVVRMSQGAEAAKIEVDLSWVSDALCRAIYASLPMLTASPYTTPSLQFLPFSAFLQKSTKAAHTPCPEIHPDDSGSHFLLEFKEAIELMLNTRAIVGGGVGTVCASEGLVQLVECLIIIACHISDPIPRLTILKLIVSIIEKYPVLASTMDFEGMVMYGSGEEKSFYWATHLLNTSGNRNTSTQILCNKLKSFVS